MIHNDHVVTINIICFGPVIKLSTGFVTGPIESIWTAYKPTIGLSHVCIILRDVKACFMPVPNQANLTTGMVSSWPPNKMYSTGMTAHTAYLVYY